MRLLHTADWHIGRRLNGFDLADCQWHAFEQLEQLALAEKVDGIVIAGDLFDRKAPAEDSVKMLNAMLQQLNLKDRLPIYAISGNHDSAVRLATGSPWFSATQFYMTTTLAQAIEPVELKDTQLFLLPYFELFEVQAFFKRSDLTDIVDAFNAIVLAMQKKFDPRKHHILVAHFFASGSSTSDSETKLTVGGLGAIPIQALASFDDVWLGHLHNHHALATDQARYSGSLLKFSLSEVKQNKGVWITDTQTLQHDFHNLTPLHDVIELTDSFEHLTGSDRPQLDDSETFVGINLTDIKPIPNVMARLRELYPHIISLNRVHGFQQDVQLHQTNLQQLDPLTLLTDFYENLAQENLSPQQLKWATAALTQAQKESNA